MCWMVWNMVCGGLCKCKEVVSVGVECSGIRQ